MYCSLSSKIFWEVANELYTHVAIRIGLPASAIIIYLWECTSNVAIGLPPHEAGGFVNELANDIYLVYAYI